MAAITTPPVRVSYPTLFTARAFQAGQDPTFSIVLMFSKTDKDHVAAVKALHDEAKKVFAETWPDPAKAPRIPIVGHDKSPIKDGDKACDAQGVPICEKNPEYAGHYIVRAGSKQKPVVVDRNRQELLDKTAVYGGCFCKINLNPFTYNRTENKGVTFGLNGVQLWADGEPFGNGRPKVDQMFEAAGADDPSNYGADPFGTSDDVPV